MAEEGNATFRGHLRLGESTYWLTNVEMKSLEDNLTLGSDLMEPLRTAIDNSTEIVGHITVDTTSYESFLCFGCRTASSKDNVAATIFSASKKHR